METVETKADNAQSTANTANQNVEEVKKQTIYEVDVMYALSSSSTVAPTSGWSTTAPIWQNGKYMWQKTVTTYGDGSKTESNATCITGAKGENGKDGVDGTNGTNGQDGAKGDTGIGVEAIVEQYYLSNSNTTQTGGSWKETQDTWTSGKYIWTRNKITWTDNSTTYTAPILATGLNNANSVANTANNTANTANITANQAKGTADDINNNLTQNYYTKTETNSQINQKADSITSEVSKTYSTKTETTNAKNEAINSANSSTDKKLEDYTVTEKLGTVIEQNWEHIKVAWNQISQYLQLEGINGKATLNIYNENNELLIKLDQYGNNFYYNGTFIGTIGTTSAQGNPNSKSLAFSIGKNTDFMAWAQECDDEEGVFEIKLGYWKDIQGLRIGADLYTNGKAVVLGTDNKIGIGNNNLTNLTDNTVILGFTTDRVLNCYNHLNMNSYNIDNARNVVTTHRENPTVKQLDIVDENGVRYLKVFSHGDYVGGIDIWASDGRLKNNIKKSDTNALEIIKNIKHRQFDWKSNEIHIDVGYVAQELKELNSDFILEIEQENGNKLLQINGNRIIPYITKAIQEQQTEIDNLKEELKEQKILLQQLLGINNIKTMSNTEEKKSLDNNNVEEDIKYEDMEIKLTDDIKPKIVKNKIETNEMKIRMKRGES